MRIIYKIGCVIHQMLKEGKSSYAKLFPSDQHSFECTSVNRLNGERDGVGIISISHFTKISANFVSINFDFLFSRNLKWDNSRAETMRELGISHSMAQQIEVKDSWIQIWNVVAFEVKKRLKIILAQSFVF